MMLEDFRTSVKRSNSEEGLVDQANQLIMAFKEMEMIDDKFFANLFGRSTPNEVMIAFRQHTAINIEVAKKRAEEEAAQEQQMINSAEAENEQARADKQAEMQNENARQQSKQDSAIDQIVAKGVMDNAKQGG